ncbi:glycosyl hydrolase family 18 protein [Photobacterium alginatilyticum]|uniref:glycosyl hydrolase family 18 protein n=1 Tax=Photobacterium alginatilyticum TaxID=1775171 RepID=UPI0040675A25
MNNSLMVGYLQSWSSNVTFTQAAECGYNAIVLAFGEIDGSTVNIYDGFFAAAHTPELLKQDISNAKEKGAKQILLSVGGANNTYNPGGVPVNELAGNIVSFLNEYGFTGIDFDLEIEGDGAYLDELCQSLKSIEPALIITAAPQLNQGAHETDLILVSSGNCRMYDQAVNNHRFDYLFIQAYNNPWPVINNTQETDVEFISNSFINLTTTIPNSTKIVIGEPADRQAAGTSIFTVAEVPDNIYQLIHDQYETIYSNPQFGGAMVWSINLDAQNGYQFVNALKGLLDS